MKISKIGIEEWQEIIDKVSSATFYHSPKWYQVWKEYNGTDFQCLKYTFKDSSQAIFPFQIRKRLFGLTKEFISGPAGTYGGWIPIKKTEQFSINISIVTNKFGHLQLVSNPFQKHNKNIESHKWSRVIDLSKIKEENIIENWSNTAIKNRALAFKENFTFHKSTKPEEWKEYFQLYQESIKRWGDRASNNYLPSLFEIIAALKDDFVDLLFLRKNNEMVCGGIYFKYKNRIHWWHGALGNNYTKTGASFYFQSNVLSYFKSNYEILDLGSSGGHVGVDKFKERIGAKKMSYHYIKKQPFVFNLFNK